MADGPVSDIGNPISVIKNKLHALRLEKDVTEADIDSLQHEKAAIRGTLPKLLHVLIQHRDNISAQQREIAILDKAIAEIEDNYGHILYSPDFYENGDANQLQPDHREDRGSRRNNKKYYDDENSRDNSEEEGRRAQKKKGKEKKRNKKYKVKM